MTTNRAALPGQDKVEHLVAFLTTHHSDGAEVTVIARSSESPVIHALEAFHETLVARGGSVRTVILQSALGRLADADATHGFDIRLAVNPRLLEAHEQMVIGSKAVWIGDCMRRDPVKRDAFTQEKVGCAVTSTFAALSFEKLWALGTPYVGSVPLAGSVPSVASRDVNR